MTQAHLADPVAAMPAAGDAVSLEACDDFDHPDARRYCPTAMLGTFTLLMAGHGRCVSTAMMLGDHDYAMWQLARAQTIDDDALRPVVQRLFAYFDDARRREAVRA